MSHPFLGLLLAASLVQSAWAVKDPSETEFIEEVKAKETNPAYEKYRAARAARDAENIKGLSNMQSARHVYLKFHDRVRVPGFISSSPIPELARVVGPSRTNQTSARMGDTLYIRWAGAPLPRPGDRYATYTPAVVIQNMQDPTDFQVKLTPPRLDKLPKDFRLAGYFYESTGRVKVIRIQGGLVEAIVEQLSGQVEVGSELMPIPPLVENITKIESGLQLSAAVICGSPYDRLSTTKRSFIYINRGARDGIRVGRVLQSIETVGLDGSVAGAAPEVSNGEAVVIHTTDSYSTAMILKQFDVIRVGSLLRTKQESNPINPNSPFEGYQDGRERAQREELPEVPNLENNPESTTPDETLPDPVRRETNEPTLSELDSLEKSLKLNNLTPEEKARLGRLSRQEKLDREPEEEESDTPTVAPVDNSFKGKKAKKDGKKSRAKKNEEEELNLLMMQN